MPVHSAIEQPFSTILVYHGILGIVYLLHTSKSGVKCGSDVTTPLASWLFKSTAIFVEEKNIDYNPTFFSFLSYFSILLYIRFLYCIFI